jgi:DNA-binding response OmpR family regulator
MATTGVRGASPIWDSAAPTTRNATTVTSTVESSHVTNRPTLRMTPLSSRSGHRWFMQTSRFPQAARLRAALPIGSPVVATIVLVEDDLEIRTLAASALADAGLDCESAGSAMDGLQLAVKGAPDLVVLDLGLPDLDGAELLRMIRAVSGVPIIVATARDDEEAMVGLLNAGADDYVVKPYSGAQLVARIQAVLRRVGEGRQSVLRVGALQIDVSAREAVLDGDPLDLSPKEFDLLRILAERQGEVLSKRDLLAEVWREPYGGSERTVDVHLSWLRKKLGESAQDPRFLRTVHGVGVKLVAPDE